MSKTTKLEAVNILLSVIGEAPVNTLDPPPFPAVSMAINVVDETNRLVQSEGWNFNRNSGIELAPDVDGNITVAPEVLHIDSIGDMNVVELEGKLYNKDDNTFTFEEPVEVEQVLMYDFESIPEPARRYITIRAARMFQSRAVGSQVLNAYTEREEQYARMELKREEGRSIDRNLLTGSEMYRATARYRR